jgi:hypothetical protein
LRPNTEGTTFKARGGIAGKGRIGAAGGAAATVKGGGSTRLALSRKKKAKAKATMSEDEAATKIQAGFRGHLARKEVKKLKEKRNLVAKRRIGAKSIRGEVNATRIKLKRARDKATSERKTSSDFDNKSDISSISCVALGSNQNSAHMECFYGLVMLLGLTLSLFESIPWPLGCSLPYCCHHESCCHHELHRTTEGRCRGIHIVD